MNRDEIATQLKTLIERYIEDPSLVQTFSESSELTNHLHINSLHLVDIVLDVESNFDIEVSPEEADQLRTVGSVLDLIESKRNRAVA